MQIIIIFYKFSSMAIKYIKIFCFELLKIYLNILSKIIVFSVCDYILIELIYYIFIKNIIVRYFNIYPIIRGDF